ncbi:MAG: hypothetical protein ABSF90_01590 [Syntrophobacteraceae bacterium]|jgi:hypothetical protein
MIHDPADPPAVSKNANREKESQERRRMKPDSPKEERGVVFPPLIITCRSIVWRKRSHRRCGEELI